MEYLYFRTNAFAQAIGFECTNNLASCTVRTNTKWSRSQQDALLSYSLLREYSFFSSSMRNNTKIAQKTKRANAYHHSGRPYMNYGTAGVDFNVFSVLSRIFRIRQNIWRCKRAWCGVLFLSFVTFYLILSLWTHGGLLFVCDQANKYSFTIGTFYIHMETASACIWTQFKRININASRSSKLRTYGIRTHTIESHCVMGDNTNNAERLRLQFSIAQHRSVAIVSIC